jgi:hypothetical protein
MSDWIEVGLLGAILLVQVLRWLLDSGLWAEAKQRRQLRRKRRAGR